MKKLFSWLMLTGMIGFIAGTTAQGAQPARPPCSLLEGRYGHAAVADDQRIYVVGGSASNRFLGTIEAIDPATGTTELLTSKLIPRRYLTAVLVDGKIYIMGGVTQRRRYASAVEIYDIATGEITRGPKLPTPRRMARAVALDNKIYVIGGEPQANFCGRAPRSRLVEILDLESITWSRGPGLITPRDCAVVAADGALYAIGGFAGGIGAMRNVEGYVPGDMMWQALPDLPFKMSAHSAVATDDQIFTFGDYKRLDRVTLCDLDSGEWQLVKVDYIPSRHNASVIFGDEIFVTGGNTDSATTHLDIVQRFRIQDLKKGARPVDAK